MRPMYPGAESCDYINKRYSVDIRGYVQSAAGQVHILLVRGVVAARDRISTLKKKFYVTRCVPVHVRMHQFREYTFLVAFADFV